MTSVSFWKYYEKLLPYIWLNFFIFFVFNVIFTLKATAFSPLRGYLIVGIYSVWTVIYLLLYWLLDKRGLQWHEGLKTIHLIGSIGLGSLTLLIFVRYLIVTDFSKPMFSPYIPSIWSEFETNLSLATTLMFLFLQPSFLINLVRTLAKGSN